MATVALAGLGLTLPFAGAQAVDLITNGGFESLTNGPGQLGYTTNAAGWTTSGYNFVFASGTADTTGSTGSYGALILWGPADGSNNGLPASSPAGGNFVGADGAFEVGAITQVISGLTVGHQYAVSFWWAGAQQDGFTGTNTEQWDVSLGSETQDTAVLTNTSHGFTAGSVRRSPSPRTAPATCSPSSRLARPTAYRLSRCSTALR
ncbi:MAG TPA: hypothetical protein VGL95_10630 [Acetobacteraceae bacterium]